MYTFIFLFLPQYLALFDLVHLSQFSLTRRKQIFSLSQPSEIYFNICPYCSWCKFPILVHVQKLIQFDLIPHISVKFRKSPPAWPFYSHEWPGHNFSLQYQYIIKQTTDQNSEKTINQVIIIWSNTKPQNKLHKKYMTDSKEKFHQDVGNERANYVIIVFGVS